MECWFWSGHILGRTTFDQSYQLQPRVDIAHGESVGVKHKDKAFTRIPSMMMDITPFPTPLRPVLARHECLLCSHTEVEIHSNQDLAETPPMRRRSRRSARINIHQHLRRYIYRFITMGTSRHVPLCHDHKVQQQFLGYPAAYQHPREPLILPILQILNFTAPLLPPHLLPWSARNLLQHTSLRNHIFAIKERSS